MQVTPQITFRDVKHSPEVEDYIHDKINKMGKYSQHVVSCRVVISNENHHQHSENHYQTHVKITVPKKELVATRNGSDNLYKSIDDAFEHIIRQLNEYGKMLNGR